MLFEDALGLVLREAALELAPAAETVVAHRRDLGHARTVESRAPDVLRRVEERLQQADGVENLQGAGLDRGGACLAVRAHLPLDQPRPHTMSSQLRGDEHARRTRTDDENVASHATSRDHPCVTSSR